jgi:hypothetical protein
MNQFSKLWNVEAFHASGLAEGRRLAATKERAVELAARGCRRQCPGGVGDDLFQAAARIRRERLAAVPDLSVYPELEGCREALEAADRGFSEGAGLRLEEVALLREAFWMSQLCSRSGGVLPGAEIGRGCTGVFIADSPHGPLAGNNWDVPADEAPSPPGKFWRAGGIGCIGVPKRRPTPGTTTKKTSLKASPGC